SVELHDKVIGHYLNIKHYQQVGVITKFNVYQIRFDKNPIHQR
ncbi:IS1 family transposase, partial [Citrobacter freundii]